MRHKLGRIYCKHCKYFRCNVFDSDLVYCTIKTIKTEKYESPIYGYVHREEKVETLHPEMRNQNFDCRFFKQKFILKIFPSLMKG